MALAEYKRKRNFSKTAEPRGAARKAAGRLFVVQKHDASHLHYDFRLELGGVLVSWAVPKGPSLNPADKRLAVRVEDHPVEYGSFEGAIPEGEYGGGTVLLWDRGEWTPLDNDPAAALARGRMKFTLEGEKLHGRWSLARMAGRGSGRKEHWLLIKGDDEHADRDGSILEDRVESVASGRTIEEIAARRTSAAKKTSRSTPAAKEQSKGKPRPKRTQAGKTTKKSPRRTAKTTGAAEALERLVRDLPGIKRRAVPESVTPQLCTLVAEPPQGDQWLHEIKFDGYRLLVHKRAGRVRLLTRSGIDWSGRFPPVVEALEALPLRAGVIDGEVTVLDASGRSSFQDLQNVLAHESFDRLAFYAFDLLSVGPFDLRAAPLLERKRVLHELIPSTEGVVRYSDHVLGTGEEVHAGACRLSLEGIVSKRIDAPYVSTRADTWLKVRCGLRQEFVVIGFTPPAGSRQGFGSLLLAAHDDEGELRYTGHVGTGFNTELLREMSKRLRSLKTGTPAVGGGMTTAERRTATWVRPELVAEVAFTQWTADRRLRHPTFLGLREDKRPESVVIEKPAVHAKFAGGVGALAATRPPGKKAAAGATGTRRRAATAVATEDSAGQTFRDVTISSGSRIIDPESESTKLDLARYYDMVAERILPHIQGRPLSAVRCPQGRARACFFQKHVWEGMDKVVASIAVREKDGDEARYIAASTPTELLWLVQFGVIELHAWGARREDLERPDRLIFDLDPGEGVGFAAIKRAASDVRTILEALDLECFLKTSGGKGLHVVVPLRATADWVQARAFSHNIAVAMERADPARYVASMSKAKRRGRIFVDYLRNARGATAVAPFSARARPGLPVSAPMGWDELDGLKAANQWTIGTVGARLKGPDPWAGFGRTRQSLTAARLKSAEAIEL